MLRIFNRVAELMKANRPPETLLTEEMLENECIRMNIPFEKMSTNAFGDDDSKSFYRLESEEAYIDIHFDNDIIRYQCLIIDGGEALCLDDSEDLWDWPAAPSDQLIKDSKNAFIYKAFLTTTSYDSPWSEALFSNLQKIVPIEETIKIVDIESMLGRPMKFVLLESEAEELIKKLR